MGKGKKGRKQQDDDWENDVDEIAHEAGIENTKETVLDDVSVTKKKEKKKKKMLDGNEEASGTVQQSGLSALSGGSEDESTNHINGDAASDDEFETMRGKKNKKTKAAKPKPSFSALVQDSDSDDDKQHSSDGEAEVEIKPKKTQKNMAGKPKPSFSALAQDSDSDDGKQDSSDGEAEVEIKPKKTQKKKKKVNDNDDDIVDALAELEVTDKPTAKSKKKKKGKATENEDEDLDNILADLEASDKTVESKSKKKKKKGKAVDVDAVDDAEPPATTDVTIDDTAEGTHKENKPKDSPAMTVDVEDDEDGEPRMKTAAEKKAEKKERDKKKKNKEKKKKTKEDDNVLEADANHEADTQTGDVVVVEKDHPPSALVTAAATEATSEATSEVTTTGATEATEDQEGGSGDEEEEVAGDKKKKKKKKKKATAAEEEEKKKGKKPNKAVLARMQEALDATKREEERLRAEEEEKQRAFEEAEERRLEKVRLEQEKKDRKKLKEKERKERLKKEGKLLTPAQREQKRRAEAMLLAMQTQAGMFIPAKQESADTTEQTQKKKVQYGKKKKQPVRTEETAEPAKESVEPEVQAAVEEVADKTAEEPTEKPTEKDDEDVGEEEAVMDDDDDVQDAWDSEDKVVQKKVETKPVSKKVEEKSIEVVVKKQKSEEDEEEESESEEESEDEASDDDDGESSEEESSSEEEEEVKMTPEMMKAKVKERILNRRKQAELARTTDKLRSPVICVMGHVDTGKTKILDKIRRTNVQDGEAGGITQQIGATNIPRENINTQCKHIREFTQWDMRLPGLLVIDTPGHESFANLRSRGSNLCDMAILVVDIMHGLEPQTLESINMLRSKQTPFIVALNKIDRLFEWKSNPKSQVEDVIKKQKNKVTKQEFDQRSANIITQLAEQGLNAALFYANPDPKSYISIVPTSAHSGDGMGDLIFLICQLTQSRLAKILAYSTELESTVMEVKAIPGLGMTIDVILVNGKLSEGDTLITGGIEGAVVTQIRSVLTPQPMKELRVKGQYIHHPTLEAAQGVKLCAKDLDKVLAGSPVYVAQHPDEVDYYKAEVEEFVSSSLKAIQVKERGVYVQASTLGSLEALLEFLKTSKIPYCGVNIGPVHKKDAMKCSVMLEHEPMYAVILAFDVKVERDAQEFADKEGIQIFTAEIIYHLFDRFTAYCEDYKQKKRDEFRHLAVWPVKMKIMPEHIFNTRDPIVVGVHVEAGTLMLNTPILAITKDGPVHIGICTGLEANNKPVEKAATGTDICAKIDSVPGEAPKLLGRHFLQEDVLISKVTRESIDVMKQYFREEMTKADWQVVIELKKILDIH